MKQLTLIALYGEKPTVFSELISNCQERIAAILGNAFQPASLLQVHTTIVGLSRLEGSKAVNLNLACSRKQFKEMDIAGFLDRVRGDNCFPLHIQVGGFQKRDYPFTSQGRGSYERSFSIDYDKAILIGWPVYSQISIANYPAILGTNSPLSISPLALYEIRKYAESFNILYKYHITEKDLDNDFYLRIGYICSAPLDSLKQQNVENSLREYLSKIEPVVIEVKISDVYLTAYEDEHLPLASTNLWSITDPVITPEFVRDLCGEGQ